MTLKGNYGTDYTRSAAAQGFLRLTEDRRGRRIVVKQAAAPDANPRASGGAVYGFKFNFDLATRLARPKYFARAVHFEGGEAHPHAGKRRYEGGFDLRHRSVELPGAGRDAFRRGAAGDQRYHEGRRESHARNLAARQRAG